MKIDKCYIRSNSFNKSSTTDNISYYNPRKAVNYPTVNHINKTTYRVFFNNEWVFAYELKDKYRAYCSVGIFEFENKLVFLLCWGTNHDSFSVVIPETDPNSYSVKFYSSTTSATVETTVNKGVYTSNKEWIYIESILSKHAIPTNIENNLTKLKKSKERY